MTTNFCDIDTFYLANCLSVRQLRHELHRADIKACVAENYRGTEYETPEDTFPWADYRDTCEEALKWIYNSKPKTQALPNHHIDIEAIKTKNDIVVIIEQFTKLRKSGRNFTGRCPIHQDKNPSLTVYPDSQSWHCFGCGRGGDVIDFIQGIENTDFRGATAILGGV